ncbi:MAG: hypothetical protein ACREC6_03195 [Hyphomicrobiaceae bacterium]
MTSRVVILILVTVGVSACAASSGPDPGAQFAARGSAAADFPEKFPKSVAARVLAAIALERVTGRKTDPARFLAPD